MPIAKQSASKDVNRGGALSINKAIARRDYYRARPHEGFNALVAHLELCADPRLAALLVECATAIGRYDVAQEAMKLADDAAGLLQAQLHLLQGRAGAALAALTGRPDNAALPRYFGLQMRANLEIGRYAAAKQAAEDWAQAMPYSPAPYKVFAGLLADQGDGRAAHWYGRAVVASGGNPDMILDLAEWLMTQGDAAKAREVVDLVKRPSMRAQARMARLAGQMQAVA